MPRPAKRSLTFPIDTTGIPRLVRKSSNVSLRRRQRVVVPVGRAAKRAGRSDEWPGDDSSDTHRSDELERNLADPVQLADRDDIFVRSNLEHAVGGRIHDRPAGANVLSPSRSMISVPDATTLPSVRRPIRCSKTSMTSGGKPSGNVGNA